MLGRRAERLSTKGALRVMEWVRYYMVGGWVGRGGRGCLGAASDGVVALLHGGWVGGEGGEGLPGCCE